MYFFCLNLDIGLLVAGLVEFMSTGKETHAPKTHLSLFKCSQILATPKNSL